MKSIIQLLFAGFVGGLVSYAALQGFHPEVKADASKPENRVSLAHYAGGSGVAAVPDFVNAASAAMPAVVHIRSVESEQAALNRRREELKRDPFFQFFGENFFYGRSQGIQPREGFGSGVIISQDGYIVTNNHVVAFADEFDVTTSDNRKFRAKLVGKEPKSDLAVLKIEGDHLPAITLGNSDDAKVGEWVLAIGNPFNLTNTVTAGIISAKSRNINILDARDAIEAFIQTDAAVNPGNSGGALVNTSGELIGINTAISTQTGTFEGYSFAIPVNLMKRIVDDIIQYGSYRRAMLGVELQELDEDVAAELNLSTSHGILLVRVMDGGSAQYAGLQENDVITRVNGKEVKSVSEIQELISRAKIGDIIQLSVLRNGKYKEIPVKLRSAS